MQQLFLKGAATLLAVLLLTSLVLGQVSVPNLINFQGRLTDASGNPVADGSHTVNFTLWTLPSGGSNVWTENTSQTTSGGLFTHQLGSVTALPEQLFQNYDSLFLQIQADGQTITPRIKLTSTPYTRLANNLEVGSTSTPGVVAFNTNPSNHNFNIYGDDGLPNIQTGGTGFGEIWLNDSDPSNDRGVALGAYPSSGGALYLGDDGGVTRISLDAGNTGNASVILPNDAINAAEMFNEPGISASNPNAIIDLSSTTTMEDLAVTTLTIPTDGYIVVRGSGYLFAFGTTGVNEAVLQIDETAGGSTTFPYITIAGESSYPTTGNYFDPFTAERVYFKTAGSYTFRLEAKQNFATTGTTRIVFPRVVATFFPTSYGSVSAFVSSSEASSFENAASVTSSGSTGVEGSTSQISYQVDLRELELKAAKAEAEAKKARLELMEARLKQNQQSAGVEK